MTDHLVFLSVPGLRPGDVHDLNLTPTLCDLARRGASCQLVPTFPCVSGPVQATMLTGVGPGQHGVVGNGWYDPHRRVVEFGGDRYDLIERPTFFTLMARQRPDLTSAAWFARNTRSADATYVIASSPARKQGGATSPACTCKPRGLYARIRRKLGPFPQRHYWGPLADVESTRWIVEGALWLAEKHAPSFQYLCIPHLDYAQQRFGPDSPEAGEALGQLDEVLGDFRERYAELPVAPRTAWVLAGEYAMTRVTGAALPNCVLRRAGLLKVRRRNGGEYLDLARSDAFAMVDHQFAHVFVNRSDPQRVAEVLAGLDEVQDILVGRERAALGMDHPRSAPIILISRPDRWFAYTWWFDDAAAPSFARTVDRSRKPGYDPLELFTETPGRRTPLDVSRVQGSHGAPVTSTNQRTLLIASDPRLLEGLPAPLRDVDVFTLLCRAFGIGKE